MHEAHKVMDGRRGGAKLILHLSSSGSPKEGRSVGSFQDGRKGRLGSETGSEISEIMISGDLRPWKSPQRRVGQGRSVGPTRVGTGLARAGGSVGRGR